jgi:tripeptide aminopeptidase
MESVVEKFLRYVRIDTQSQEDVDAVPSTAKQWNLARLLEAELKAIGLIDVRLDEHGYVTAALPATPGVKAPVIGFAAHVDTSPETPAEKVQPRLIENYDGSDIRYPADPDLILTPHDFPELLNYCGQTLIVTDGSTLLGADDKAGVAEIMTALQNLVDDPSISHGEIRVAFTPDEEVGHGPDFFDVKAFGADFAYTVDGGEIGELEFENFNAASARVVIHGRVVHPGDGKDRLVNSILIGMELQQMLPVQQRPEFTSGYEGFYYLLGISGSTEKTTLDYIIRDHDRQKFDEKKAFMEKVIDFLRKKYPAARLELEIKDQYYNMREKIEPVMHVVHLAERAMREVGVEPKVHPIRGGTDGARFSYMGLPTPNLFTGGHNFHGRLEYVPAQSMEKAVQVIVKIAELSTQDLANPA